MAAYCCTLGHRHYQFRDLKDVLAKASPARSGDQLAGIAAESAEQRVAAQMVLADVPLERFLQEPLIAYESDEITRLICDEHDANAFAPVSSLTTGQFRDWLLSYETDAETLRRLAPGLTPEMVAAVSKLMRNQDLVLVARKCEVVTRFRNTIGLRGRLSVRLQPNHPTDDARGIAASIFDGLCYGCGDAVIGINPATDRVSSTIELLKMIDALVQRYEIPTQSCVLAHVTNQLAGIGQGATVGKGIKTRAANGAAESS